MIVAPRAKDLGDPRRRFAIQITPVSAERSRLILSGALTAESFPHLERAFVAEVARGRRFLVVDMGAVTELKSCVFGVFMEAMALLRPISGNVSFVNVSGIAVRVLKMLGAECQAA